MQTFTQLKDGNRKYLLIPVMPTPNGGLHLGHLSGPFLKMDVLARAQRRNGNEVSLFFGTDVYESYMNLKSWQTGKDEALLCDEFNERVKADLDALNIQYDAFINPLEAEHNKAFTKFFTNTLQAYITNDATELRDEEYLYSEDENCFLTGCWVTGNCPVCGSGSGSYQCEDCGTQYRPMDLQSPSFKRGNYPLTTIKKKELYLVVRKKDELFEYLAKMEISADFVEIVKTYFDHQGNYIRLTNPGEWGISYQIKDSNIPHVLFTYSALYFYSLYCGELYKNKYHIAANPFGKNEDVITVASFGIDCTVPYLAAGVALGLESDTYRPIDFIIPNHFYTLENDKFSTSRGHAIWGADIINKTPVTADAIRYFLVLNNPEHRMADFKVDAFLQFVNTELADTLQPLLTKAWAAVTKQPVEAADIELVVELESLLLAQNNYLTPPSFEFSKAGLCITEWTNIGTRLVFNSNNAYWWLKGFALLTFPVMPDAATAVWNLMGHVGEPAENAYFLQTEMILNYNLPCFFESITFEAIQPALPATLFTNESKYSKHA